MKELWVQLKDIVATNGMPSTIQGVTYKAKTENWKRRRVLGVKGRVYEYEVSSILNKDKDFDNKLQEPSAKYNRIPVNNDFFDNYVMVGDLSVETADNGDLNVKTNGIARIILAKDFVEQQGLANAQLATFTATDDSMTDTINNGDTLMVSVYNETELQRPLDGIYVILFNNVLMVKRLQYNPVTASYNIISDNAQYQSFTITPKDEPTFRVIAKLERVLSKK
ncbi:helix-turn-helix domain-containing protein [Gilliamella sp. CG22]|uniref:helix-turn-helix domain-containing protein n=1 Tax=Gilliamella sp. CG22 TaxID=3351504 RepID=UPI003985E9CC